MSHGANPTGPRGSTLYVWPSDQISLVLLYIYIYENARVSLGRDGQEVRGPNKHGLDSPAQLTRLAKKYDISGEGHLKLPSPVPSPEPLSVTPAVTM